jgi:hypothetical protein
VDLPAEISEPGRVDRHVDPRPDERTPSLVLVDRDVHAVLEEDRERVLDAVSGHEPLEVSVGAAGQAEQLAVWTAGMLVDGLLHEGEEPGLPVLEPAAEDEPRLDRPDRRAEERRKGAQEPRADDEVGDAETGDGQPRPQYRSVSRSRSGKALTTEGVVTGVSAER